MEYGGVFFFHMEARRPFAIGVNAAHKVTLLCGSYDSLGFFSDKLLTCLGNDVKRALSMTYAHCSVLEWRGQALWAGSLWLYGRGLFGSMGGVSLALWAGSLWLQKCVVVATLLFNFFPRCIT